MMERRHRFFLLGYLLLTREILSSSGLQLDHRPPSPCISRRQTLKDRLPKILVLAGSCATAVSWSIGVDPAHAARGAAELDLEFYLRDAFGGNPKQGSMAASAPPQLPPPRTLQEPLLSLLLDDECSLACIPCQALVQTIQIRNNDSQARIESDLQKRVASYRDGPAGRSFGRRAMWQLPHVTDQYYFDLTSYALWRAAADLLPNYVDRFQYMRSIGKLIYQQATDQQLLKQTFSKPTTLSHTNTAITDILNLFTSSKYCKGYRITVQQDSSATPSAGSTVTAAFDEYDDDDLASGAPVNCLVSIYEPATLGACLQLTGEQSRFWPDFIAPTLAAMWEAAVPGIQVNWEIYFVDSTYRPNPKDYFPDEQLFQFTLTKI
jgi:hypothetical protein